MKYEIKMAIMLSENLITCHCRNTAADKCLLSDAIYLTESKAWLTTIGKKECRENFPSNLQILQIISRKFLKINTFVSIRSYNMERSKVIFVM